MKDWESLIVLPLLSYADDTTFFLKEYYFYKANDCHLFSYFPELKPNLTQSETADNGVLKRVQVAVCCLRCIHLNNNTLKIFGTHFFYNKKLKEEKKNFIRL